MSGAQSPAVAPRRESPRDWKWTAEKVVARRAFDLALSRKLEGTVREAKERAARITETSDLWELEAWLGEQRRRIDRDFDYRYSVLPLVLRHPAPRRPDQRRRPARPRPGQARHHPPHDPLLSASRQRAVSMLSQVRKSGRGIPDWFISLDGDLGHLPTRRGSRVIRSSAALGACTARHHLLPIARKPQLPLTNRSRSD